MSSLSLVLRQCNGGAVPARLEILLPRPDARPTGPLLGGTWKQVMGPQEGSPPEAGSLLPPLRFRRDSSASSCGRRVGLWRGLVWPRFRSRALQEPAAASRCRWSLSHGPGPPCRLGDNLLCGQGRLLAFSLQLLEAGRWLGTARSGSPCSRTRSPVGSGAHQGDGDLRELRGCSALLGTGRWLRKHKV